MGGLFGAVALAGLLIIVWAFGMAATCEPGNFFCGDQEGQSVGIAIFGLAIAGTAGAVAFTLWRGLHRRILGDPDAWWLWFEKPRTEGSTVTSEWLRDVNRRRARGAASATETKRAEEDHPPR
jgi:hypothetical protein